MATRNQIKEALLNTCVMALRGAVKSVREEGEPETFPADMTLKTCLREPGFPDQAAHFLNHAHFDTGDPDVQDARAELRRELHRAS